MIAARFIPAEVVMKNTQLALILPATLLALAGCGEKPKPAAQAEAPASAAAAGIEIRIGHVAPLTGAIAHLGNDKEYCGRHAIEQANDAHINLYA
jgi:branched-chain amino acid transport system substrate-binding protein